MRASSSLGITLLLMSCGSTDGGLQDSGVVITCPAPTGAGVSHSGTISASETWKAADGPHLVTFDVDVSHGATLTIEPCADVRVKAGYTLVVEGTLIAEGTAAKPITLEADDPAKPWGFMQVFAPGTIRLAYATLSNAGAEMTNAYGALEARGDQALPAQEILKVDHVTVRNSVNYGVSLRSGAAFTADSQALTVTGSALEPLRILPRLATNLPTGTYTGNTSDGIRVETESYGDVNVENVTFHDRGVPYFIGGPYTFGELVVGPGAYTLTLEAGVVFKFKKNGGLRAESNNGSTGLIVASGTQAKPVVFTSLEAAPAAGDWRGIELGSVPGAFAFDHVEVHYAGGASQSSGHHCQPNPAVTGEQSHDDDASLAIYHQPGHAYLTNSLIADSAGDAVDLAYQGSYVDFKPTNTFTNVASCQVTLPLPTAGLCPNQGCP